MREASRGGEVRRRRLQLGWWCSLANSTLASTVIGAISTRRCGVRKQVSERCKSEFGAMDQDQREKLLKSRLAKERTSQKLEISLKDKSPEWR